MSQGSVVTQFTANPALPGNGPGMFGGDAGENSPFAVERFNTIFPDLLPAGTVHGIEWATPSAISLTGWQLEANGDGNGGRQFSHLTLLIDVAGSWVTVSSVDTLAYDPVTHVIVLSDSFTAVSASRFRVEFTQASGLFGQSGPRIAEFDAVTTAVPEPSPAALLLGGLGALLAWRKRYSVRG